MCAGGTYTARGDNLISFGQPKMNGWLVIVIQVLVGAVLLHDEDLIPNSQKFVQFSGRELGKGFLKQSK